MLSDHSKNEKNDSEEWVEPILYYFPPDETFFGHVAIGGLPKFSNSAYLTYLSYGKGDKKIELIPEGEAQTLRSETAYYCKKNNKPIELRLPPCPKKDLRKAQKQFGEKNCRDYDFINNNCAHAVCSFMQTAGYLKPNQAPKDPRPVAIASLAVKIIEKFYKEQRTQIKNNPALSNIEKIAEILINEAWRLKYQIHNQAQSIKNAALIQSLATLTVEYSNQFDPSVAGKQRACEDYLKEFIETARKVDKKTAAHLAEALELFEFGNFLSTEKNSNHPEFLRELQKEICLNAVKGNKSTSAARLGEVEVERPLLKGEQMLPRMKEIVKNAKQEILISGYKIDKDSDGEKDLIEALEHLNNQPIQGNKIRVCILINKKNGPASFFTKPTPSNSFREGLINIKNLDIQYVEHQHSGFGSYHQKQILVDGTTAILSSSDLMKRNDYKDKTARWVDMSSILKGETFVGYLRDDFRQAWDSSYSKSQGFIKAAIPTQLNQPIKLAPAPEKVPALFLSKKAEGNVLARNHLSPYAVAVIKAINIAKKEINVMTPNLNNPQIITALVNAVRRGVKVNIVMAKNMNDRNERLPFAGGTNQTGVQTLYNALDKNYLNLEVRWVKDNNGSIIQGDLKNSNMLHARMVTVDEEIVLAGSSVMDQQSIYHSRESDVVIQSKKTAKLYLENIFLPVFNNAVNIFNDPLNVIKAAGPVVGFSSNKAASYTPLTPTIVNPQWQSTPDANILFRLFNKEDEQNALQELVNFLEKPITLISEAPNANIDSLPKDTVRVSCFKNQDTSFGLIENWVKPQEITSRLIMPSTFKVNEEEMRLMGLIHQQVQQAMKTLAVNDNETLKLTLYSFSVDDIVHSGKLDNYEKAYIKYCLEHNLECQDKNNNLLSKSTLEELLGNKQNTHTFGI